jgi:glycosyltransferase involved in cell wall biosynthesis
LFADGVTALGHTPGNVDSLAYAMNRLMADTALRARLGEHARTHAVEHFHQDRFGRELIAIYESLIAR